MGRTRRGGVGGALGGLLKPQRSTLHPTVGNVVGASGGSISPVTVKHLCSTFLAIANFLVAV